MLHKLAALALALAVSFAVPGVALAEAKTQPAEPMGRDASYAWYTRFTATSRCS
ncbi:hypothetical protein GCM10007159_40920 [Modicisalibacter luteus]|nr:hypothetical protein GCM10007159_40920 [Halomonas lutea]